LQPGPVRLRLAGTACAARQQAATVIGKVHAHTGRATVRFIHLLRTAAPGQGKKAAVSGRPPAYPFKTSGLVTRTGFPSMNPSAFSIICG
jgi:hypothetical protein